MPTVAEQIGQTPHLSPLLRRLRRAGLTNADDMRRLAVARGCAHYRHPDDDLHGSPTVDRAVVSDVELAFGMLTAAQQFNLLHVRCAAQLLSTEHLSEDAVIRLATLERALPVLQHIARAGVELDTKARDRWERILSKLPPARPVAEGRLPHRSRFVAETGLTWQNRKLDRSGRRVWLRPLSKRSE